MARSNTHTIDQFLKIKLSSAASPDFTCKKCPVDHGSHACPRATKKSTFEFDFNKLLPILQQRFVDIASVYEKSKLQRVSKSFNALIKPEKYTIIRELIAHTNNHYDVEHTFWNINGFKTHVSPEHEPHLEKLHDLIVNRKFNGVNLPEKWLTKCLNQNVTFYLTKLHINDSVLTHNELKAVCGFGALESIYIDNVTVQPPPRANEIAMWTTNIARFHVSIKNFVCETNWVKYFTQFSDKRSIRSFYFTKLSPSFNANDFDQLIRTRMVSTKRNDNDPEEATFQIEFDGKYFNHMKKKSLQTKLDRMFQGVFKRVPKVQYDTFAATDRFMVEGTREEKSCRTYFFVNCRAIDALMKKVEEQKITKSLGNLRV